MPVVMHSSSKHTDSSTSFADRKPDRFARPPSIHYTRYGEPCVGLPDKPSKRIVRHEVEARVSSQQEKVSRRMAVQPQQEFKAQEVPRKTKRGLSPTYMSSPDLISSKPPAKQRVEAPKKQRMASQRYAARQQFESTILARREADERSSNFMSNRAACLEMERISWRSRTSSRRK